MIEIKVSPGMGRGLYAVQNIGLGQHVETCELLVLSEIDTKIVNKTDLYYYTFKYNNNQDCIVLGNAEIFNHSQNPNVMYSLANLDGRRVMVFVATRPIKAGEQLFIDYQADADVDTEVYKNKNLIG